MAIQKRDRPDLILGTAQLVNEYGLGNSKRSEVDALHFLEVSKNLGITTIDTAPAYGSAERIIGLNPGIFNVHTKITKGVLPRISLQNSLQILNVDAVDILYVHDISDFRIRSTEIDRELSDCLQQGANRVGVSLYSPDEIDLVLRCSNIQVIQIPLNVFDRRFIPYIKRARDNGLEVIARSIFLQGLLLCPPDRIPNHLNHLNQVVHEFQLTCEMEGLSAIEVCMSFVDSTPGIDGVIIGAQSETELEELVSTWQFNKKLGSDLSFLDDIRMPDTSEIDPRQWNSVVRR